MVFFIFASNYSREKKGLTKILILAPGDMKVHCARLSTFK